MGSVNRAVRKQEVHLQSSSPSPYHGADIEGLRKRSSELLNKFRKVWNESEYQEWCAIQRLLHKIL